MGEEGFGRVRTFAASSVGLPVRPQERGDRSCGLPGRLLSQTSKPPSPHNSFFSETLLSTYQISAFLTSSANQSECKLCIRTRRLLSLQGALCILGLAQIASLEMMCDL